MVGSAEKGLLQLQNCEMLLQSHMKTVLKVCWGPYSYLLLCAVALRALQQLQQLSSYIVLLLPEMRATRYCLLDVQLNVWKVLDVAASSQAGRTGSSLGCGRDADGAGAQVYMNMLTYEFAVVFKGRARRGVSGNTNGHDIEQDEGSRKPEKGACSAQPRLAA